MLDWPNNPGQMLCRPGAGGQQQRPQRGTDKKVEFNRRSMWQRDYAHEALSISKAWHMMLHLAQHILKYMSCKQQTSVENARRTKHIEAHVINASSSLIMLTDCQATGRTRGLLGRAAAAARSRAACLSASACRRLRSTHPATSSPPSSSSPSALVFLSTSCCRRFSFCLQAPHSCRPCEAVKLFKRV